MWRQEGGRLAVREFTWKALLQSPKAPHRQNSGEVERRLCEADERIGRKRSRLSWVNQFQWFQIKPGFTLAFEKLESSRSIKCCLNLQHPADSWFTNVWASTDVVARIGCNRHLDMISKNDTALRENEWVEDRIHIFDPCFRSDT
jgi:hypothetical protein